MLRNETKSIEKKLFIKDCRSILSKSWGLMFSKKKKINDSALIFYFKKSMRLSFHMFFVFYPIDIIFLNSDKKVVDFKRNFKPFTTYTSKKPAKYVVEVKKGIISKLNIDLLDKLRWD